MERKELSAKLKAINAKIEEIESAEEVVYATANKFIPSVGHVHQIQTKRDCAKALTIVNKQFSTENEAAKELGLTDADIQSETNYLGFKKEVWVSDLQKRVNELTQAETLAKLENAKKTLMKHRTADDIFSEDMDSISDVLEGL